MKKTERQPLHHYWHPRYWPTWIGIGILRLTCFLPYRWQIGLGKALGRVVHRVAGTRRAITRRNIELCFPELTPRERDALALRHFEALGASLMEFALSRWASDRKLEGLVTHKGVEHIIDTLNAGHGVILLSGHFTALEISGRTLRSKCPPFDAVFRKFRSPLTTDFIVDTRERAVRKVIEKNDIKTMVRALREGAPVWYSPDQAYHQKQSALIPFFGIPAMTNTATTTLARLGRAKVIPYWPMRLPEGGYEVTIGPPIEGIPSDDPIADTIRFHEVLEAQIRKYPEQYYWVHRRFKNRPDPLPDVYADLDPLK